MTKKTMKCWFVSAIGYFIILVLFGVLVSVCDSTRERLLFSTFIDLVPLLIAIPVAWLGYCFQRRITFLQQLRSLWTKLIDAVHTAIQFTDNSKPSLLDRSTTLFKLQVAIDEVRCLFKNIDETETDNGLYPFEPVKDIFHLIDKLEIENNYNRSKAESAKKKIFELWKDMRRELLKEFDREQPTFSHSHWKNMENSRVYERYNIPKTPT